MGAKIYKRRDNPDQVEWSRLVSFLGVKKSLPDLQKLVKAPDITNAYFRRKQSCLIGLGTWNLRRGEDE